MRSKIAFELLTAGVVIVGAASYGFRAEGQAQWQFSGQNLDDSRNQPNETIINASNVNSLVPLWIYNAAGSVSVSPVVEGNRVYFPDWAGYLYSVDRYTGQTFWRAKISDFDGYSGAVLRVSPAIYGNELFFGDNQGYSTPHNGANLIAVNRFTGELLWITQIDPHPAAIVTGPAVVYNGVVYQGVSSSEEALADGPTYPCCTFRGSVVAVNAATGKIIWQNYTVPDNNGAADEYSGGAIWQEPVVDPTRGLLYVGTSNNYSLPAAVLDCQTKTPNASNCESPNDHFDSVLAMDLQTGKIRWSRRLYGYDVWTVACIIPKPGVECPSPHGPDYDLGGSGGNLLSNLVGFGQKSGMYWALNPENGNLLWGTMVGPAGILWGTATDGQRIYVAISDASQAAYTLTSGQKITWGSWSALDASTGKILWQTADPTPHTLDIGSVSVANGVLYTSSYDGHMYALDAATGKILWSYASGGSVLAGPSIVDGVLYWGSGYPRSGGKSNNKVYAFMLAPHKADLYLQVKPSTTTVHQGDLLTYAFPVWNFGPSNADHEVLNTQVPAGTTFDSIRISGTSALESCTTPPYQGTGQIVCHENASMAPNTTWTVRLTVKVTAPASTVITESAATTSDTPDPNMPNNMATVNLKVQ